MFNNQRTADRCVSFLRGKKINDAQNKTAPNHQGRLLLILNYSLFINDDADVPVAFW